MIPPNITRDHILRAMREIERNGVPPGRSSRKFHLIFEGRKLPPKYTLSLANRFANGRELDSSEFGGGQETNNFFKRLGRLMKIYGVLHEIKYSIIRAIAERVVELNRKLPPEKRIINLTMGQNYIGNTSFVLERIGMLKSKNMGPFLYAPSLGTFEARESIAKWFYKLWYGVELDLSSVMITDGAMGAIRNAMGARCRRDPP